jgi:hypothetical protein
MTSPPFSISIEIALSIYGSTIARLRTPSIVPAMAPDKSVTKTKVRAFKISFSTYLKNIK